MPTINQLVRQGRTSAVKKSTAPGKATFASVPIAL